MSEHAPPVNSAKLLLPVAILGMLLLLLIVYKSGGDNGVVEYRDRGAQSQTTGGH